MYVHPAFKVHHAVGLAFAAARGFGQVIACEGGRPVAALLPFHVMEANGRLPRLQFHVARPNPLAHLATKGGPWLIAVAGDDAYVSPHWYASAEQVPTWLYETVQLSGPVHVVPASHTADHLDRLAAQFESALAPKPPWVADGMLSSQRRATLMESIVAIEMTIETVEGSFKLNQHKADADHVAVVRALREQNRPSAHAIAARMVALRPHLAYEQATDGKDLSHG
jgi:transcriptional regulator